MANDNIFRSRVEKPTEDEAPKIEKIGTGEKSLEIETEPPFTDYENIKGHPFLVDHFQLGDSWKDKMGGFEKEVNTVNNYLENLIDSGKLKNNIGAVKTELKRIYKMADIKDTERSTMQIEKLIAFIEYQNKLDQTTKNFYRYGNSTRE